MPFIKTKDGVEIFYKDWGKGQPIVFSHGWPLSSDDWDAQMMFFLNHGFRDAVEELDLPRHTLNIAQQFLLEMFLRLGINPPRRISSRPGTPRRPTPDP